MLSSGPIIFIATEVVNIRKRYRVEEREMWRRARKMSEGLTLERYMEVMCGTTEIPIPTDEDMVVIRRNHEELIRRAQEEATANGKDGGTDCR